MTFRGALPRTPEYFLQSEVEVIPVIGRNG